MSRKTRTQNSQRKTLTQTTLHESFGETEVVDIDDQVNDVVRYIIYRAGEHMIMKRSEILKNVIPKAGRNYEDIIVRARNILRKVYGYNLLVCDSTSSSSKAYVVSNALPHINTPTENVEDQEYPEDVHKILLMLILTHIFMSNNSVTDVSLYGFLKSLKIDVELRHEVFGSLREYITQTLVKKHYIVIEIDPMSKRHNFSWGQRSEKEISKQALLQFVCKMYGDRVPKSWVNQFRVATEQGFENYQEGDNDEQQMEIE